MICLNLGLGAIASVPGSPISVDSNCYYNTANSSNPPELLTPELEDIPDELLVPSNMTNTGIGDGLPLDNFLDQSQSLARQAEIAMSFFTGGYVINSIASITLGCTVTCDQALINGKCDIHNGANFVYTANVISPMWTALSTALQGLVFVALILTIIYLITGKQPLNPYS